MKIVHIVAGLAEANGMALTVARLAREESLMGHDVVIVTASDDGKLTASLTKVSVRVFPVFLKSLRFSFAFARGIRVACEGATVVHTHSAWTFPVWWGTWCAKRVGARLVMTPNGPYDPVRRAYHSGRKRLVSGLDRWALRAADAVHAISSVEKDWILEFEPRVKRFAIASLGVDLCEVVSHCAEQLSRTVLYLGRIHPLKGLDLLLKAWQLCQTDSSLRLFVSQSPLATHHRRPGRAGCSGSIERTSAATWY